MEVFVFCLCCTLPGKMPIVFAYLCFSVYRTFFVTLFIYIPGVIYVGVFFVSPCYCV